MKNISDNSLSELQTLFYRINNLIERDFSHVEDFIPAAVKKANKEYHDLLNTEKERREDED